MGRFIVIGALSVVLCSDVPRPRALSVPAALGALELSDLLWLPALSRYVLVTDEAPFLVTMTAEGELDDAPLRLAGVDDLNDAEALARGPDGTFFLSTSHAPNKKGALKPARRQLLWLGVEGGAVVVKGRLDLTLVRDAQGRSLPALVSGDARESLDVEALAFHDGALLVGLKAPLTPGGRAALLRLSNITHAFEAGEVSPQEVSMFAQPLLQVRVASGERVPQGISALLELPDGRWLLGANAPKSGTSDEGGALWLFDEKTSTLLTHFERLKPEGVALSNDGTAVLVVFDEGGNTPKWLRVPLPR